MNKIRTFIQKRRYYLIAIIAICLGTVFEMYISGKWLANSTLVQTLTKRVTPNNAIQRALDDLTANRLKWDTQSIHSYRYTIQFLCFCSTGGDPVTIEVANDRTIAVTTTNGLPVTYPDNWERYNTIPKVFDSLQKLIDKPSNGKINVQYDPLLGYPTDADLDPIKNAIDDEIRFAITNFQIVN